MTVMEVHLGITEAFDLREVGSSLEMEGLTSISLILILRASMSEEIITHECVQKTVNVLCRAEVQKELNSVIEPWGTNRPGPE